MISNKIVLRIFVGLFVISMMSCESLDDESVVSYNKGDSTSRASFIAHKNSNKIITASRINGVWNSSKGGDKYKWVFSGNKLLKSTIYSFGETGVAQSYDLKFLNGFDGTSDEFGNFIYLKKVDSAKGICYEILKATEHNIVLKSKFGDRIILTK